MGDSVNTGPISHHLYLFLPPDFARKPTTNFAEECHNSPFSRHMDHLLLLMGSLESTTPGRLVRTSAHFIGPAR